MSRWALRLRLPCVVLGALLMGAQAWAQGVSSAQSAQPSVPAPPRDSLGRDTPRGTVLGFMESARKGNDGVAPLYLNTPLRDRAAVDLAHKLFVVLDSRLPPRLSELSDRPEGSLVNPLKPDQDVVGLVTTAAGPLDLVVERVNRGAAGPVWLFSRRTLAAIPDAYDEVDLVDVERFLPEFLTRTRIAGIRLFEWAALGVIVPLSYRLAELLGRLLRPLVVAWRRRRGRGGELPDSLVPGCVRLLLPALVIRWLLVSIELPLQERQFWSAIAAMLAIASLVWALLLANGWAERCVYRRFKTVGHGDIAAMLRLGRRMADVLVVAAGVLVTLHYFGFDPTAALAGLGIGGIAVALAAQKTLENVVGGVSIIFDEAVRVGDFLKFGETLGTVDYVGLRSTRIRTLDRTILSVPNGQIANASIETLSARDKFWFHHFVALRFETTPAQMRAVLDGIRHYLRSHPFVDASEPIRVRFFRLGPFSFDVEVFAYVLRTDWELFLDTQEELLLGIMEVVERVGALIALPSQTLHVADTPAAAPGARRIGETRSARLAVPRQTTAGSG